MEPAKSHSVRQRNEWKILLHQQATERSCRRQPFCRTRINMSGFIPIHKQILTHAHTLAYTHLHPLQDASTGPQIIFSFVVFILHVFHFTGFYVPLRWHLAQVLENTIARADKHTHTHTATVEREGYIRSERER